MISTRGLNDRQFEISVELLRNSSFQPAPVLDILVMDILLELSSRWEKEGRLATDHFYEFGHQMGKYKTQGRGHCFTKTEITQTLN